MKKKPSTNRLAALMTSRPRARVAIQAKTCSAVGTTIARLAIETRVVAARPRPAVNM